MSGVDVCLQVAQTVSFALPEPAGVFVSAGFQLLDLLMGQDGEDPNKEILDKLTEVTEEITEDIKDFLTQQKLTDVLDRLNALSDWVQEARNVSDDVGTLQTKLENTEDIGKAGSFVETGLESLLSLSLDQLSEEDAYTLGGKAVHLYVNLLMSYICVLKLRTEYRNKLFALGLKAAEGDWLLQVNVGDGKKETPSELLDDVFDDIQEFWSRLDHWTTGDKLDKLTAWCDKIKSDRLNQISEVQTRGDDGAGVATDFFTDGTSEVYAIDHTYTPPDIIEGIFGPDDHSRFFTSHRDAVVSYRAQYYAEQQQKTDSDFAYVKDTIKAIRDQANQLSVPVPEPSTGPTVSQRNTGWDGAWKWPAGTRVRYGIRFLNTASKSDIIWSSDDLVKFPGSGGQTCPSVTLPIDDEVPKVEGAKVPATTHRFLYRELQAPGQDKQTSWIRLRDNTTTEYVDLDPADPKAVCPNATEVPMIYGWRFKYREPGSPDPDAPSWPPGYKVRYCYVYVMKEPVLPQYANTPEYLVNAWVRKSLVRSPWSQCDPAIGECDAEGYCTGKDGGYLAELKIKHVAGADACLVYRQFKGMDAVELLGEAFEDYDVKDGYFFIDDWRLGNPNDGMLLASPQLPIRSSDFCCLPGWQTLFPPGWKEALTPG